MVEWPLAFLFCDPLLDPLFLLGHQAVPCGLVRAHYTLVIGTLSHILPLFFPPLCHLSLDFVVWGLCLVGQTSLVFISADFPGFSELLLGFLVGLFASDLLRMSFCIYNRVLVTRGCITHCLKGGA